MICASVQTVHLSAQISIAVVKTKVELDSHVDTCVVGDHCLIVCDHNRPFNVYGYNPKAGLKHARVVDAAVTYKVPETGQVVFLSIYQAIEIKSFNHHLLCPMQCCMNGMLKDEVPKFLALIPSGTMHAIQIEIHLMLPT